MNDEVEEFEELLENNDTKTAIAKYYKKNAKKIAGSIFLIILLIYFTVAQTPVWTRIGIIILLFILNYVHGKVTG